MAALMAQVSRRAKRNHQSSAQISHHATKLHLSAADPQRSARPSQPAPPAGRRSQGCRLPAE
eukprot:3083825-Alexandrium_andersonii.AAC.1